MAGRRARFAMRPRSSVSWLPETLLWCPQIEVRRCSAGRAERAPYRLILGEGRGEGVGPAGRVAWAAQAVVNDPAGPPACVGADVVAQQEMREQEITAPGQDLDGFAIVRRRCQEAGMPAGGQQRCRALLAEHSLVHQ